MSDGSKSTDSLKPHSAMVVLSPTTIQMPKELTDALKKQMGSESGPGSGDEATVEPLVSTEQTVVIGGETIEYTATAGHIDLKKEDGTIRAKVFFTAYTRNGEDIDPATRPITYTFNGGPGSSSVWLHLGAFGPRKVVLTKEGFAPPPPYCLEDNEYSLLDVTDLVFIDPVSTGFSRAVPDEDAKKFHGVMEDIESVAEFIREYTTRFNRWSSPKFLAGESYGTTRAAGLSGCLQKKHGMYLNGLVLVSSVLNFQTLHFDKGNDLPYLLFFPTYAATAWYHGCLGKTEQAKEIGVFLDEVRQFAQGPYNLALMRGSELGEAERRHILSEMVRFTGLSESFIDRHDLRVEWGEFADELLRDKRRAVGRLDSRFTGVDEYGSKGEYFKDPSYTGILGPFTACLNDYVRRELQFNHDWPYAIFSERVDPWNYGDAKNRYLDVAETMREAMSINPHLYVFVANGYYDVATPFYATEYTFSHLGLDPSLTDHISMGYYEAGHMMYVHQDSLDRLKGDIAAFMRQAIDSTR